MSNAFATLAYCAPGLSRNAARRWPDGFSHRVVCDGASLFPVRLFKALCLMQPVFHYALFFE